MSGLESDLEGDPMLLSMEFYDIVVRERDDLRKASSSRAFRWVDLKKALDRCHEYFRSRSLNQVRDRFKYIKRELASLKN